MSVITLRGVLTNGAVKADGSRPLAPYEQPIVWPPGEDGIIKIVVFDSAGVLANLTDCSVELGIKRRGDSEPTVLRLANLIDPINAEADVYLVSADTAGLAGAYFFDVWVRDDAGRHQIVATSNFILPDTALQPDDLPDLAPPVPPVTNGAVDTVGVLATVDASRLKDGFVYWVRGGANDKGPWHIEISGNGGALYAIDSSHITALNLTNGQWIKGFGPVAAATFVLETIGLEWGFANTVGEEDVIDDPRVVAFAEISAATLVARLIAHVKVSGGTGTYYVRIGGTLGLPDGTIIATGTTTSATYTKVIFTGSSFTNPGGDVLLQITGKDGTVGQTAWIKGANVELVPA